MRLIDINMSKASEKVNRGRAYEISKLWLEGWKQREIADKFGMHPEQIRREIKKAVRRFLEYEETNEAEDKDLEKNREVTSYIGNP